MGKITIEMRSELFKNDRQLHLVSKLSLKNCDFLFDAVTDVAENSCARDISRTRHKLTPTLKKKIVVYKQQSIIQLRNMD